MQVAGVRVALQISRLVKKKLSLYLCLGVLLLNSIKPLDVTESTVSKILPTSVEKRRNKGTAETVYLIDNGQSVRPVFTNDLGLKKEKLDETTNWLQALL